MKQLIVCSGSDLYRLHDIVSDVTADTTLLVSAGEYDFATWTSIADKVNIYSPYDCDNSSSRLDLLQEMKDLQRAYFVVSSMSMFSTAYQAMTYSLYPRLLQIDCWKITLEETEIRGGFAFIKPLPEAMPEKRSP